MKGFKAGVRKNGQEGGKTIGQEEWGRDRNSQGRPIIKENFGESTEL
jgi:hypothetical protein